MLNPELIGRLHPLLVHLPIGIILFATALMVFGWIKKTEVESAVSLAWGLGALSALLACGAGWLLAQSGEYDADMVQIHQWTGLATAGFCTLTFFGKRYRPVLSVVSVGLLTVAGHYGGNLTHGEDYLFPGHPIDVAAPADTARITAPVALRNDAPNPPHQPLVRRTFLYRDRVAPLLKAKCYSCHSASKKKGGLRLDSEAFIRKGGKNGSVLTAGNPAKSKLFAYLLLPQGDDRHMPPKGKLQLSAAELALLHHWIQKGASFQEEVEVIQPTEATPVAAAPEAIPALPPALQPDSSELKPLERAKESAGLEAAVLARAVDAPDPALLTQLKQQQVTLSQLAEGTHYLSANFVNTKTFEPALLEALAGIHQQVVRLRLSDQPVNDTDIQRLRVFRNLTRLNLENTRITDAALPTLAALPNLEQLNLYGTAVTDAGLDALAKCPTLKVVYLWQTQTTPAGIRRLQKARPTLKIETGTLQLTRPDTIKTT